MTEWICGCPGSHTPVWARTRAEAIELGAEILGMPIAMVTANPAPEPIAGAPVPEYPTREELGW